MIPAMQRLLSSRPIVEELESRVLYSADLAPGIAGLQANPPQAEYRLLNEQDSAGSADAKAFQAAAPVELVVVDARVDDADILLAGLNSDAGRHFEVIRLARERDGIAQISELLRNRTDVAAVHFFAHGEEGRLLLGNSWFDSAALDARNEEIAGWGLSLTPDADLLIYGCDVGANATGREFVQRLAQFTRADVAASDDPTGQQQLGGDWILELASGSVQTNSALSLSAQQAWNGVLLMSTNEIQVNQTTANDQVTTAENRGSQQAVALDAAGNYVVVWTSNSQDGAGDGVYARRFSSNGAPLTGEILVNATTNYDQKWARVASDSAGNFVVTWTSENQDGTPTSIYARRFDASGNALTAETAVNTTATGAQTDSVIAMSDTTGDYVVAWHGEGPGDTAGIFFRRFNADGTAKDATDRLANLTNAGTENGPAVAMAPDGRFQIVWEVNSHIYFQRFDAGGGALGGSVQVDSGLSPASGAAVAVNAAGNFTVTYRTQSAIALLSGVWVKGFNADGSVAYNWSQVSSGDAASPSIDMVSDGSFVVAYQKTGDGLDVFARKYNADGSAVGTAFQVNQHTIQDQANAAVAMIDTNNYVVAWSGESAGDAKGVIVRQYGPPNVAPVITSNGGLASAAVNVAENATAVTTVTASDADLPTQSLTYSINGGADAAKFSINASTGVLSFTAAPNFEAPTDAGANNVYDVIVQASDGTLNDTQAIAVTVTPVNDNNPEITSNGGLASAAVNVAENATAVTTVTASDADLPTQSLTYSINGGADAAKFSINASTGVLSFTAAPNFEAPTDAGANNVYDVIVQASDGTLNDTQAIAVTVTPVNDNNPEITSNGGLASAAVNVAENATAVTTVTASDADLPTQSLTYSINGGADAAKFSINASTGVLSFTAAPNFEAPTDAGANNVYDVIVQASDGTLNDTQAIAVTVTPVNDNNPEITSNGGLASAAVNVAENATAVTTVTASDADLPTQSLTYSINGGADAAKFSINASSGALSFIAAPDFEVPNDVGGNHVYDVTVQVSDGAFSDTQLISVTVSDANEFPAGAVSDTNPAVNSVAENAGVGTLVGVTASAIDPDATANVITYTLDDSASGRFTINAASGALMVAGVLDYETATSHDVTVRATSADGSFSTALFTVGVTNVNEQAVGAISDANSAANQVAENSSSGTLVGLTALAIDPDGSAITYSLIGNAGGRFAIDPSTGVVELAAALDAEQPTSHTIVVQAESADGSSNTQTFTIAVNSINDNTPVITSDGGGASASINVAENANAVTTVTASDADLPAPTLTYSLVGGADQALFSIDASTGVFAFLSAPNFEAPADANGDNVYEATVQVSDGNLTTTQAISVTVNPDNDNTPVITSDGGGASASINVAENANAVTTVTASDADLPAPTLTYSLVGGADQALFSIDASTGVFAFLSAPNFEAPADANGDNVYEATVQVSDGNLTTTQAISVTVNPDNDNTPVITSDGGGASASINVAENANAVTTVTASDADLPAPTLTYSLVGGADQALFSIDASTGVFAFLSAPNFEAPADANGDNVYEATVQVSDGNLTTTQAISVTVNPDNDNTPVITSDGGGASASINVAENANAVTTVTASDADLPAPTLTYSLVGGADQALFSIDASTGVFAFLSAPNFEAPADANGDNVYEATVQVSDGNLTTTQAISVTVNPDNDNTPVITSDGGGASASINVAENANAVTTVTASDADLPAPTLTYSLVGGADQALFSIDASTGVFAFLSAPNFEAPADANGDNVYEATVQVSDGNLTTTQAISVTVNPDNDNTPVITSDGGGASASINVAENANAVTTVTASDADLPAPTLTYSLVGGADQALFSIDASTGVFAFLSAPNFEAPADANGDNVYEATVQVSDGNLTTTQAISVTVNPDNDNTPVITSDGGGASASINVAENANAVTTVTASDADLPAPTLTYSLVGGADQALFSIDASTGVLTFASAPDYETTSDVGGNNVYDVIVQVSDGSLTGTQAIAVTVSDANEFPAGAVSDTNPAVNSVAENAGVGTLVGVTASAIDPDATANVITYTLDDSASGRFTINAASGALMVAGVLDYETATSHVVTVRATSADGSFSTTLFTIDVTNANESSVGAISDVNVLADQAAENSGIGTLVGLSALGTDSDVGDVVSYSLIDDASGRFAISATTGVVTVAGALDAEAATSHTIVVRAGSTDGSFNTQTFTIAVNSLNDNAPDITSNGGAASASISVAENSTAVATVTASDADLPAQTLTYSLVGGADQMRFTLDPSSGFLALLSAPNFEAPTDANADNVYEVTVQVGDGTFSDTQAIRVTVINVNEPVAAITDTNDDANQAVAGTGNGIAAGITARASDPDTGDSAAVSTVLTSALPAAATTALPEAAADTAPPPAAKAETLVEGPAAKTFDGPAAQLGVTVVSLSEVLHLATLTLPGDPRSDVTVASSTVNQAFETVSTAAPQEKLLPVQLQEMRIAMLESMQLQTLEPFKLAMGSPGFARALDEMRDQIAAQDTVERVVVGTSVAVSGGLSVGYVLWLLRGTALLGSLLSTLPAWAVLDPVPVLAFYQRKKRQGDDDDDLSERMFEKQRTPQRPVAPVLPATAPANEFRQDSGASSTLVREAQ